LTDKLLYGTIAQRKLSGVKKELVSARILQGEKLDVFREFKQMDVVK